MRLPDLVAYQAAVQHPSTAFSDPQLRAASVAIGNLGLPRAVAGNFAVTYQLRAGTQQWAVRCFHREAADRASRYAAISQALARLKSPALLPIDYSDSGVRVGAAWYPITKMPWIEGFPLNRAVEANLSKPGALRDFERRFVELTVELRRLGIAHGDLQHGNILVEPSGNLRLVDYDGMFVPALRGRQPSECGDPNYQHPRRGPQFDTELDRFAALVIVVALRALAAAPRLWHAYNTGDNLLFRRADFANPASSPLFRELSGIAEVRDLAQRLSQAATADVARVPLLDDVLKAPSNSTPTPLKPGHVAVLNSLYGPTPTAARNWKLRRATVQHAIAIAPDGTRLAAAERSGRITVREATGGRTHRTLRVPGELWSVAFTSNGLIAASIDGPNLCVWDAEEKRKLHEVACGERPLRAVALSEGGGWLASATADGLLRCWQVRTARQVAAFSRRGSVSTLAVSRDGQHLAVGVSRGEVQVHHVPTTQALRTIVVGRRATALAFTSDGSALAVGTATGDVTLFDLASGRPIADLASLETPLVCLALSRDTRAVAAAGGDGTLWLRRVSRQRPLAPLPAQPTPIGQRLFDWLRRVALL